MPPDLSDLLHTAAPRPTRPVDARRLVLRARRRALAIPAAGAALGLVAVVASGVLVSTRSTDDRLAVNGPMPTTLSTSSPEVPLGSGACPQQLISDGSGESIPADFVAEVLVVCGTDFRTFPGEGAWQVLVERRSRDLAARTVELLRRPDEPAPAPPSGQGFEVGCTLELPYFPHIVLLDTAGTAVQARIPRNACGKPDPELYDVAGADAPLTEVAVTRINQLKSEAEVVSGCQGYKNMIAVEAESPSKSAVAGPVFPTPPKQLQVCVYRQTLGDPTSATFSRGRQLTIQETGRLVSQELGNADAGPDRCRTPSLDYVVLSGHGGWVLVELGGCNRVLRDDYTRGQLRAPSRFLAELG